MPLAATRGAWHGSHDAAQQVVAARCCSKNSARDSQKSFTGGSCEMLSLASTPRFAVAGEEYAWRAQCDGNGGLRRFGASNGWFKCIGERSAWERSYGRVKTEGELLVSHVHQSIPVERHRDLRGTRGVVAGGGVHGASTSCAAHRVGRVLRPGRMAAAWERCGRPAPRDLRARGSERLEALHAAELES